jgi:biopolymer transport protein ExbD
MKLRSNTPPITSFSMQSLTDIVFLLLIFFLLSSTFILQTGIKVQLPRTTAGEPSSERTLVLSITGDGSVYLNEELVSRPLLVARIRQQLVNRDQIIILRADKTLSLDKVVEVMNVAKTAGGSRFLIATETKD